MKKGLALLLCLVLMASMFIFPMPSQALRCGKNWYQGAIDASFIRKNTDNELETEKKRLRR